MNRAPRGYQAWWMIGRSQMPRLRLVAWALTLLWEGAICLLLAPLGLSLVGSPAAALFELWQIQDGRKTAENSIYWN